MTKRGSKTPREGGRNGDSPGRKAWTAEDDATLIGMWRSRVPTAKIAAKLGRTVGALRTRASRLNLPPSMRPDAFPKGEDRAMPGLPRTVLLQNAGPPVLRSVQAQLAPGRARRGFVHVHRLNAALPRGRIGAGA